MAITKKQTTTATTPVKTIVPETIVPEKEIVQPVIKSEKEVEPVVAPKFDYEASQTYAGEYAQRNAIPEPDRMAAILGRYMPPPIDPQKEKQRNSAGASIAESMKSLAEIFGQARGAHLRERKPEESLKAEQNNNYLTKKYNDEMKQYAQALANAEIGDKEVLRRLQKEADEYGMKMAGLDYNQRMQQYQYDRSLEDAARKRELDLKDWLAKEQITHENQMKLAHVRGEYSKDLKEISKNNFILQDSHGNMATLGVKDWNAKVQLIYTAMKANGLAPLTSVRKDPSDILGMRTMEVEDKNANNIAAYVLRNIDSQYMTQNIWDQLYALQTGRAYNSNPPPASGSSTPPATPSTKSGAPSWAQ
ncbi:hypothetical protein FACS189413_17150 [Bacteroidia bacterium]|nr:hypothetical protein FACS189413_17150 [Bacteroidia bacterium]